MADRQRDVIEILSTDHREVEAMFTELETLMQTRSGTDDELRRDLADQITIELVRHSVAEEEGEMFPRMRELMTEDELVELGRQVDAIKAMAPTRPHPGVPHDPGKRLAVGPVAGLFDRLRDTASGRGVQE